MPSTAAIGIDELLRHAAETRLEGDGVVAERQRPRRRRADVEHDLAVLDVRLRHEDTLTFGVDDEMRREAVVEHPLVHRPQQIRALLRRGVGYCRSSRSMSVRLAWNDGRENTSSM